MTQASAASAQVDLTMVGLGVPATACAAAMVTQAATVAALAP
eukprot:CAMPEP_0171132360 /NCGR_PEP_ID=MMETSP0766_2-20121228/124425_1 /TAXON_ID=439317 /ORGANISM="Gambierdiscus australes, Strain CAWD 149" /LENGTH=41 /DNA_ID= /DNA_START= /DNA_END= /DNA_ORIENTATION=